MLGTMLWFNDVKDLGAIDGEDGERLQVAGTGFAEGERPQRRCAGMVVTFDVAGEGEARTATNVAFVPEVAPRRARMRSARFRSHG